MTIQAISAEEHEIFNSIVHHPLQSYEWGEFRIATGLKVIRRGVFKDNSLIAGYQMTIHKIPHTRFTIGYLPKCDIPSLEVLQDLHKIGEENNCIYIQIEANALQQNTGNIFPTLVPSFHPLFTKYTFNLNLNKSEDELLKNMHYKTRYNIKVARKHGITIVEDNSEKAFEEYWKIMEETTKRQKFYAHTKKFHHLQWELFAAQKEEDEDKNKLRSHLFIAYYTPLHIMQPIALAAWILFEFHDTLYYPYGSSSAQYRETMASNLMMWEAIKFGKSQGLKKFDMWGALGPEPNVKDSWYGFHKFKQGFGADLVEFVGSYDLVINPLLYEAFKVVDRIRSAYLRIKTY